MVFSDPGLFVLAWGYFFFLTKTTNHLCQYEDAAKSLNASLRWWEGRNWKGTAQRKRNLKWDEGLQPWSLQRDAGLRQYCCEAMWSDFYLFFSFLFWIYQWLSYSTKTRPEATEIKAMYGGLGQRFTIQHYSCTQ